MLVWYVHGVGTRTDRMGDATAMRITITIDDKLAERYKRYAKVTGQSVVQAVEHAAFEWMDICGEGDLEVLTGIPAPEVQVPSEPIFVPVGNA